MIAVPPVPLRLTEAQSGALLTVRSGQRLEVRLADPSPAGPDWSLTRGPPAVVVTRRSFAPAAPSADVIELTVVAPPGRTVPLSFAYRLSNRRLTFAHVWQVRLRIIPGI